MKQLNEWLKEIIRWGSIEDFVEWVSSEATPQEEKVRCRLYTRDHCYAIVAIQRDNGKGYLGCVVGARKPRAGEDWTRGNDLADGDFSVETWQKIKNDILRYELVKIAKKIRREPDYQEGGIG